MSKVYTVELEINITADCAQEAFENLAYAIQHQRGVLSVNGICDPYRADGGDDNE